MQKYRLSSVYDDEAVSLGLLSDEVRTYLINEASRFLSEAEALLPFIPDLAWRQDALADAIVSPVLMEF